MLHNSTANVMTGVNPLSPHIVKVIIVLFLIVSNTGCGVCSIQAVCGIVGASLQNQIKFCGTFSQTMTAHHHCN